MVPIPAGAGVPSFEDYPSDDVADWPTRAFEFGKPPMGLDPVISRAFEDPALSETRAVVVVHRGRLVAEAYGGELPSFTEDPVKVDATTPLLSWSMAKSVLGIVVAQLADEGLIDLAEPLEVPEWPPGDPRCAITVDQTLEMRDGLDFAEEYTDLGPSDVIEMLFGSGQSDMASFAANHPLAHAPGAVFNYSSGTSNLLSRHVSLRLGGPDAIGTWLTERVFGPCSMHSATVQFDDAGTFIASSYLHATALDFARLGLMLCRGGRANGHRVVPTRWVDRWRTPLSTDEDGHHYSAHFWCVGDEFGTFYLAGFEGQSITICPPLDLVIVRLGSTPAERNDHLFDWRRQIIELFAAQPRD